MMMTRQKILNHFPDEDFIFIDDMDEAIIGVSTDYRVVYSSKKCVEILSRDMLDIEAAEYFEYNIAGAHMGEKTPIYVFDNLNDLYY